MKTEKHLRHSQRVIVTSTRPTKERATPQAIVMRYIHPSVYPGTKKIIQVGSTHTVCYTFFPARRQHRQTRVENMLISPCCDLKGCCGIEKCFWVYEWRRNAGMHRAPSRVIFNRLASIKTLNNIPHITWRPL